MDYPLIIGNWKMNLSLSEATILAGQISRNAEYIKHVDIVLCPAAVYIYPIYFEMKARPNNLYLGIQSAMWEKEGAYTGEISLHMVRNVCKYMLIGHSERREYFGETDDAIARKVKFSLENNIIPVVCVGEKEKFNLEDHYQAELKKMKSGEGILNQIDKAISKIGKSDVAKVHFAYEPIWAIGTGNYATGIYASAISYIIRNHLKEKVNLPSDEIKILYGGSVEAKNVREYMMQPNINGLLVGGESLKAKSFCEICRITAEVKSGK